MCGRRAAAAASAAVVGLALSLFGGCATRAPEGPGWITGRLAVRIASEPVRSVSSGFELRGDADSGELRLNSPLGSVLATATWSRDGAVLTTAEGNRRFADLDALAREALGEPLPLQALPAWLRGQPWPGAAHRRTAEGFDQLGWQIGLQGYAEGQLLAQRGATPLAPAASLRVRLDAPAPKP